MKWQIRSGKKLDQAYIFRLKNVSAESRQVSLASPAV